MIPVLSLVTSVKDYLEVVHKLIEYDVSQASLPHLTSNLNIMYSELGAIITYFVISLKNGLVDFLSFSWLQNVWSLPVIIPDISSAMISEVSVLDGYFHNAFNFLDTPVSYGRDGNSLVAGLEKFTIGMLNSLFLFLPTSTAHIITLRRFVMQGLEAGYIAGLGTIAGNLLWLASIILGWRFFVIPWLSLDIFRYILGFVLLVKYMWDSYNERRTVLEDVSKQKIFLLNFLLALTEQTSIYPFISNLSFSPEASLLESFPADSYGQFLGIHIAYLLGIAVGCFSLLQFTCWFWENPAFKIYMWMISSFKVSTSAYYKVLNFTFLYLTMISAIASIPYYGLDYTITNPLGYVNDDRIIQDKLVLETSFLGGKASDRNTRRNPGRHGRRERWKRRIRKYRTFDASLYDQGIYDLFTIEDLNYGFDRFWLRRKLRNHHVKFRFFPGPWMRGFKKQLAKPRLESYTGPRIEFFRILFEQVYHPSFHAYEPFGEGSPSSPSSPSAKAPLPKVAPLSDDFLHPRRGQKNPRENLLRKFNGSLVNSKLVNSKKDFSIYSFNANNSLAQGTAVASAMGARSGTVAASKYTIRKNFIHENSTLRKFVRKLDNRLKTAQIANSQGMSANAENFLNTPPAGNKVYSKRWTPITKMPEKSGVFAKQMTAQNTLVKNGNKLFPSEFPNEQVLRYKGALRMNTANAATVSKDSGMNSADNVKSYKKQLVFLHPLKFYLQQEAAFNRKLRYYTPSVYRKFSVENNAPYFRVMMRRFFYNYKPTNRWERTMKVASLRKARRKTTRIPRKLQSVDRLRNTNEGNSTTVLFDKIEDAPQLSKSLPPYTETLLSSDSMTPPILASGVVVGSEVGRIQKPTYNYSVVSKRASRYRYQIYKDVLQHWYYSPFNRLLMKMDVDSFIRRQPNAHFLTAKEENLLHLRRYLLSEHYNTLRWYTNMEHYRSMKTRLGGGTKSFSSRVYNQQFAGTFKKIRHLFAITPSQGNIVLKFDQPLYNEYPNTQKTPLLNTLVIHEELLGDADASVNRNTKFYENNSTFSGNQDLLSQSQNVVREYLVNARSVREAYIKTLLDQNNYTTLTQFIYKGQKTRGDEPTTNQRLFNNQEKQYLLTQKEQNEIDQQFNSSKLRKFIQENHLMEDLYVTYLKKWKRRVNDQEALKSYLTRRIDKREKRKQKKEKHFLNKIKQLSFNASSMKLTSQNLPFSATSRSDRSQEVQVNRNEYLTTGLQKSIFEGMLTLNNVSGEKQTLKSDKALNTNSYSPQLPSQNTGSFNQLNNTKKQKTLKEVFITTSQLTNILQKLKNKNMGFTGQKLLPTAIAKRFSAIDHTFRKTLPSSLGFTKNFLKPIQRKTFKNWRHKERALGKQKRLRKEFKLLNKQSVLQSQNLGFNVNSFGTNLDSRQKRDSLVGQTSDMSFALRAASLNDQNTSFTSTKVKTFLSSIVPTFKRKRSAQRHSRSRRNRGVFKKRSLSNSLKKEFKTLGDALPYETKVALYNKLTSTNVNSRAPATGALELLLRNNLFKNRESPYGDSRFKNSGKEVKNSGKEVVYTTSFQAPVDLFYGENFSPQAGVSVSQDASVSQDRVKTLDFELKDLKQRKAKQRKQRYWKQKRSKFSQKRQKYRKRRRYSMGKIRLLSKQTYKIQNQFEIQNWWWKQFLPSIQASTDALWQIEKDKLIQQKLAELSPAEILERNNSSDFFSKRDRLLNSNNMLQIGNKDFKPLALPEAIRLNNEFNSQKNFNISGGPSQSGIPLLPVPVGEGNCVGDCREGGNLATVNKLYENLFTHSTAEGAGGLSSSGESINNNLLVPNTNLPFYAGWDESLRKFVVTNRMLSRQDAGYQMKQLDSSIPQFNSLLQDVTNAPQAPLQGMNAATTLYWQIPFTTYDPDQFFALGMDGFSPIGWRKFLFRHSILKSWLSTKSTGDAVSSLYTGSTSANEGIVVPAVPYDTAPSLVSAFMAQSSLSSAFSTPKSLFSTPDSLKNIRDKNTARRLKKRYRRVKKHPRTPVWFPSGPLLNQVLPVHYIYVFYKRSRLPRDRYLKRRLLGPTVKGDNLLTKTNQTSEGFNLLKASNSQFYNTDFTLRKRLKPKRKYHLKRNFYSANVVIPRRFKFMGSSSESLRFTTSEARLRPLSSTKINKSVADLVKEQKLMRTKQRNLASKQQNPSMRVKQLKRRVQRQILRSVWRYRPRAGGFVWPGDYLKLELVKAPKLKQPTVSFADTSTTSTPKRKTKRKKKRSLVEWQIQPKKYLYQKHNIKVLKKKLEKAQRSDKIRQKVKELNYI